MQVKLSDHFHYRTLLKFVFPSVCMMVFTSIYGVVDGLFVSNFAGKTPFAAINLIMPFLMIMGAVGFMLGAGGSAIVSRTFGEGENEKACSYFSFLVEFTFCIGVVLALIGFAVLPSVARLLKAEGDLYVYGVQYARNILIGVPFWMLQTMFQTFFITAEKPHLGFVVTVISGVCNMAGDALLVGALGLGVKGAAWATVLSQAAGAIIPVIYFARKNKSLLHFCKTRFYGKRFFGIRQQRFFFAGGHAVQFSAAETGGRKRRFGVRRFNVRQLHLRGDFSRLLHRRGARCGLSLRREKS